MTTQTISPDELDAKREEASAAVEDARDRFAAASLDGKGIAAAEKELEQAQAEAARLDAAAGELGRRNAEQAEQDALAVASQERAASYRWMVEFLERYERVRKARRELLAAEGDLKALPRDRRVRIAEGPRSSTHASDLDTELLDQLPSDLAGNSEANYYLSRPLHSEDIWSEMQKRAAELASLEEKGEGQNRSQSDEDWNDERRERKRRQREKAAA